MFISCMVAWLLILALYIMYIRKDMFLKMPCQSLITIQLDLVNMYSVTHTRILGNIRKCLRKCCNLCEIPVLCSNDIRIKRPLTSKNVIDLSC